MNVFWHELRTQRKGIIIWLIVMIVFIAAAMVKYDTIKEGGQSVNAMLETIPQTLQAVFGMSGLMLDTVSGYVGICFIFIAVMVAIFAGMLGADIIAREETDRTIEFLYPKPMTRTKIVVEKLLVLGMGIITMSLAVYGSLITVTAKYGIDNATHAVLVNFGLAALCIMLFSGALGVFFAAAMKHSKKATGLLALVIVASYFAFAVSKMSTTFEWLRYVTIFRWFDAKDIITTGHLSSWAVVATLAVTLACVSATLIVYQRRDLTV